jgi:molybdopterin-guanine dinucleotide biosynthesis protein A
MESTSTRFASVILAGGRSSRFGRDKVVEPLLGLPMLQRVIDAVARPGETCVIVQATASPIEMLESPSDLLWAEDSYPGYGPLGGLYTGLQEALVADTGPHAGYALAVAADMPLLQPALLEELRRLAPGHDAVVPLNDAGLPEPLCAVYGRTCIEAIRGRLEADELKVASFLNQVSTLYVQPEAWRRFDPEGRSFLNVNRVEDLHRAEELLRAE